MVNVSSPVLYTIVIPTSVALVLVAPFIFWRSRIVKRVFLTGVAVRGRAALVVGEVGAPGYYTRTIPRMRISYRYKGVWYYRTKFCLFPSRMSQTDQEVVVVIDPENPKRGFVEDIYI